MQAVIDHLRIAIKMGIKDQQIVKALDVFDDEGYSMDDPQEERHVLLLIDLTELARDEPYKAAVLTVICMSLI